MIFDLYGQKIELTRSEQLYSYIFSSISACIKENEKKYKEVFEKEIKKLGAFADIKYESLINNPKTDVAILHQIEINRHIDDDLDELQNLETDFTNKLDDTIENLINKLDEFDKTDKNKQILMFTVGREFYEVTKQYSYPEELENLSGEEQIRKKLQWRMKYWKSKKLRENNYIQLQNNLYILLISFMNEVNAQYHFWGEDVFAINDFFDVYEFFNRDLEKAVEESDAKQIMGYLKKFPFLPDIYYRILVCLGDEKKELEKFANYLGIELRGIKRELLTKFCNKLGKKEFSNEENVKRTYKQIIQKKVFMGYEEKLELEQKLQDCMEKFDIQHRTVNGILYATSEEAEKIRKKSFEGVEYESEEMAALAKEEMEKIRTCVGTLRGVERYKNYLQLKKEVWNTKIALQELIELNTAIRTEYIELAANMKNEKLKRTNYIIWNFIFMVSIVIFFLMAYSLDLIFIIIGILILVIIYKQRKTKKENLRLCRESKNIIQEWNQIIDFNELGICNKANKKNSENKSTTSMLKSERIRHCIFCGKKISPTAKFCNYCGKKII